jgi:hypothetical protein
MDFIETTPRLDVVALPLAGIVAALGTKYRSSSPIWR